jgi:hypothetical protein
MTPTPKLRFVERIQLDYPLAPTGRYVQVLQQWYAYDIGYPTEKGEWRDVPMEKEQ